MIRTRRVLIILTLVVYVTLALAACTLKPPPSNVSKSPPDSEFSEKYDPNDTWAIYWYICGGSLETGHPGENGIGSNKICGNYDNILSWGMVKCALRSGFSFHATSSSVGT